jgi:hypothetical protein
VVTVAAKDDGRSLLAVAHERLPDAPTGERMKRDWRGWLDGLKALLEAD